MAAARPQRGPVSSEMALALAVAWPALRVRTAAVFVVPCGPCRASSCWPRTVGPRGRAGANENADPFALFVPPHLRDRHAQITRQERQKKAAVRDGFKCARRVV